MKEDKELETKDKTIADDAEDEITRFKKVILKDYIPKKKIKDTIKRLKQQKVELPIEHMRQAQIKVLQKLLEDD